MVMTGGSITPGAYLKSQFLDAVPPPAKVEKGYVGPNGGSSHYVSQRNLARVVARFNLAMKDRQQMELTELMAATGYTRDTCRKYLLVLLGEGHVVREGKALWSWKGEP